MIKKIDTHTLVPNRKNMSTVKKTAEEKHICYDAS